MNGCGTRRLRRELEIYNNSKQEFMPNVIYDENKKYNKLFKHYTKNTPKLSI